MLEEIISAPVIARHSIFKITMPETEAFDESIKPILIKQFSLKKPEIFDFISKAISLHKIQKNESLVLNTHNTFNIENIIPESQQLFINLHRINDIRKINEYLNQVNTNLKKGGYLVGAGQTITCRNKYYFSTFSKFTAFILYFQSLIFRRIIPKLPIFKALYFAITKGKDRSISKAGILGRLLFSGFGIIAFKEIDNLLYFIARKIDAPSKDLKLSCSLLIKLKRIGENGEIINIYKFRTMHPYSQYLQQYIYDHNQLEACGKFKNDFRITSWGKIMRRYWIDELPQVINFFKGELSLVGVRALSEHYFNLYPDDIQKLRTKFKPGLVPPYYVDMPKSFNEILDSERKYLLQKLKHPFRTDVAYFFKSWYNIILKNARSK